VATAGHPAADDRHGNLLRHLYSVHPSLMWMRFGIWTYLTYMPCGNSV
jgi:hypothetical protein